jgi:esterase/lipase superfamily enzyme
MATHYLITNRQVSTRHNKDFVRVNSKECMRKDGDEEAGNNLRYGTVTFDPSKAKRLSQFDIKIIPDVDPKTLGDYTDGFAVPIKDFPSTKVFDTLYRHGIKTTARHDILLFIHGFNTDLQTAMKTLAELHNLYVEPKDSPIQYIVMFTWPAKSKILKYRSDAADAQQSGFALARSFASLRQYFKSQIRKNKKLCEQRIHLMCHSMGNRVFESMIFNLNDLGIEINSLFNEILLIGADVDYDTFERPKPMYSAIDLSERLHIYYHNKDQALGISEITKNAFNRLGRWGAKNSIDLPDGVYQSDVSDIEDEKGLKYKTVHHWYYTNSASVVQDIKDVLWGRSSVFNF